MQVSLPAYGAVTSTQGLQERRYPYTLIGAIRSPDAAGAETGQINQLSNVSEVAITEISIRFGAAAPTPRAFFLRFASQENNVTPNDMNPARNQAFYFTPELVANDCLRWQAANEENGLVQTTDQNLLKITNMKVVVHDATTDAPVSYQQCIIRFVFTTLGSRFGAQSMLQQSTLRPDQVNGIWAM
jgi:hypothetical protein